jgi:hypothetical protein
VELVSKVAARLTSEPGVNGRSLDLGKRFVDQAPIVRLFSFWKHGDSPEVLVAGRRPWLVEFRSSGMVGLCFSQASRGGAGGVNSTGGTPGGPFGL